MLSSVKSANIALSFRPISVIVNGRKLEANNGETIMELCDRNNIKIPRLCHHPNIPPRASCRVCLVEMNGKWLSPACVTTVNDGLVVNTQSKKVQNAVRSNLEMLMASHDERCSSCVANSRCNFRDIVNDYGVEIRERETPAPKAVEKSTNGLQLDVSKCVLCGRCIRACESQTGLKAIQFANRGDHMTVQPATGLTLKQTNCIQCGQCSLYCPVGAITEKSQVQQVLSELRNRKAKVHACILDPSVIANIGEAFGLPEGTNVKGKLISALKQLGFDIIIDGALGNDLLLCQEFKEIKERIKKGIKDPMFSSNCPAFVNYIEQSHPELIKSLSSCRSASSMVSAIIKKELPQKHKEIKLNAEDIYNVFIGSCVAKKDEIQRPGLTTTKGVKETDIAITARELVDIIRLSNISFNKLADSKIESYVEGSAVGHIVASNGGIIKGLAKKASKKISGFKADLTNINGIDSIRIGNIIYNNNTYKVIAVDGISNAAKVIELIQKKDPSVSNTIYVEVSACKGGCVCGGGSIQPKNPQTLKNRVNAIYNLSEKSHCNFGNQMTL